MFFVIETQVDANGIGAALVQTKDNLNAADSEYFRILSAAAVSQVYNHGAIIINHNCEPIRYMSYNHSETEEV